MWLSVAAAHDHSNDGSLALTGPSEKLIIYPRFYLDLANPKTNTKSAGFTQEERDGMTEMLSLGFVDTFRELYPTKEKAYTYWTYMSNARARNVGWYVFSKISCLISRFWCV